VRVAYNAGDLRRTMQSHCGVFRNEALLAEGVAKVMELEARVARTSIGDKSRTFNTARVEALELDNLIECAKATVVSALARSLWSSFAYFNADCVRPAASFSRIT